MITRPDLEALLVALVLVPGTYSRNRFFALYTDPEAAHARRRAKLLRSVVAEVTQSDPARRGHIVAIDERDDGGATFTYVVPSLNLRRTTTLSELELAIVRYALAHRAGSIAPATPPDEKAFAPLGEDDPVRARIEDTLRKLAPDLAALTSSGPLAADEPDDLDEPCDPDERDETSASGVPSGLSSLPEGATER
ncbi:hypothetical protein [Polyangium mundeleinium]|uniref:Uncharacterized protein n=1 Tax=Polyangium mundeleinium TaxID=2995306 RepID=A0ABT5EG10_9BACT|nr:hypothetical protein [Polyangium mundeleinium]MDC0740163.1 hypothetical protein [Polyangium mundeleinium]